ncbi:MAG: hypothetical protein PHQ61_06190 [Candidatus Omnitrophica bacterium]|nr:hypothetical protein [Candidatus Omnitrophota bacterium]
MTAGCSPSGAELDKKVLGYDPGFKTQIEKRDSIRREISSYKNVRNKKVSEINNAIAVLKEKKASAEKEYLAQSETARRKIQPDIRQLEKELMEARSGYRIKDLELNDIMKDIKEIEALLGKKENLSLTQSELQTWNDRLADLMKKKENTLEGMDALKKDVEMLRLKIKALRV